MHINLSPEMEGFIKSKVASGFYGNATEVVRDALRRMQRDETRAAAWKAAVAEGDAELDRGEGIPYGPDTMREITESAVKAARSGTPMDPNVLP